MRAAQTRYSCWPCFAAGTLIEDLRARVLARGVDDVQVALAIEHLVEITYACSQGSTASSRLSIWKRWVASPRVRNPLVAVDQFVDSLWIDHGWGRPSEELTVRWRAVA